MLDKEKLLQGTNYVFSNENYQVLIGSDDIRTADVHYHSEDKAQWRNGYYIWFNGALIAMYKTYKPMINRLNKLIDKWHLELVNEI